MAKYLSFTVNSEKVGIKYSREYTLEETHINKVFSKDGEEFIHYKGHKIPVVDTGTVLQEKPLKKFDGLLFVHIGVKTIAFKVEGFYKISGNVDKEISPQQYLPSA
jgi:hypothetical protein